MNSQRLADFYSRLGLTFEWHRHDSGPEHFSAQMAAGTFEIYPVAGSGKPTTELRLGFVVHDVDETHADLDGAPVVEEVEFDLVGIVHR